jgi:hypothetical protein
LLCFARERRAAMIEGELSLDMAAANSVVAVAVATSVGGASSLANGQTRGLVGDE